MNVDIAQFRRDVLTHPLALDIWNSKYRHWTSSSVTTEQTVDDTRLRVVNAIYAKSSQYVEDCRTLVLQGILIPGGRINAGAGTGRNVTEINCYVLRTVIDSMPGIQRMIAEAALTMQQGGGIGVDFSTIRPSGAIVKRTGSVASGVIPFADQQDGMCSAIVSAGTRRGAMMAVLRCDHPDLWNPEQFEWTKNLRGEKILKRPSFISAKRQPGRLTQFNMSVAITTAFMDAVESDSMWDLGFFVPPADGWQVDVYDKPFPYDYQEIDNAFNETRSPPNKGDMVPWYVYRRVKARTIWEDIMRSTYTYSEPGVVFIDRVNERNNLKYCETIAATNPCGEQPLPPQGACNLGSINTAFLVHDPFTNNATFDFETFARATHVGVCMLDNVLDIANYPLEGQRIESANKRRIGLGITGWADALLQLGITYGSPEALALSRKVAETLRNESYIASANLAAERGSFPAFRSDDFLSSYNVRRLPERIRDLVAYGIRNGVLNTIAPNGTISLYVGNVSSAHEPVFSFNKMERRVRQPDGSSKSYESVDYAYRLWEQLNGPTPIEKLPRYFVSAMQGVSAQNHVEMHAAWQEFIDASISKTINCPVTMPYEEFCDVYAESYRLGAKGCTTYRDDPVSGRGSVLAETAAPIVPPRTESPRPAILAGNTYKLKWPLTDENWYITITRENNVPREMFIQTKNVLHQEWVTALSRTVTAIFRRGGDVGFLVDELAAVHSATGGCFLNERYCPSIVAAIGRILETEYRALGIITDGGGAAPSNDISGGVCPVCFSPSYIKESGCWRCLSCGHNTCG